MRTACLYLVLFVFGVINGLVSSSAWAQSAGQGTGDDRISRLEILADLWGKLWLFHPNIVTTDVDWDGALYESIDAVERARNSDALVRALNTTLLARLGDDTVLAQRSRESEIPLIQAPLIQTPCRIHRLSGRERSQGSTEA